MIPSMRLPLMFVAALLPAGPADAADRFEQPKVSYKAEIRIEAGILNVDGTTFYTPRRQRHEFRFRRSKSTVKPVIVLRDTGRMIVLDTAKHTYGELRLDETITGPPDPLSKEIVEKVRLATETKNGIPATKYKVIFAGDVTGQLAGLVWISGDNILLAVDGQVTVRGQARPFRLSLVNLRIGPQPDALFEVPEGYSLVSPVPSRSNVRTPQQRHK